MDIDDRHFDFKVDVEYSIDDQEIPDDVFEEFKNFVRVKCFIKLQEFTQDNRMSKVELHRIWLPGRYLVIIFEGAVSYVATSKRWLLTKFIEDFNDRKL